MLGQFTPDQVTYVLLWIDAERPLWETFDPVYDQRVDSLSWEAAAPLPPTVIVTTLESPEPILLPHFHVYPLNLQNIIANNPNPNPAINSLIDNVAHHGSEIGHNRLQQDFSSWLWCGVTFIALVTTGYVLKKLTTSDSSPSLEDQLQNLIDARKARDAAHEQALVAFSHYFEGAQEHLYRLLQSLSAMNFCSHLVSSLTRGLVWLCSALFAILVFLFISVLVSPGVITTQSLMSRTKLNGWFPFWTSAATTKLGTQIERTKRITNETAIRQANELSNLEIKNTVRTDNITRVNDQISLVYTNLQEQGLCLALLLGIFVLELVILSYLLKWRKACQKPLL